MLSFRDKNKIINIVDEVLGTGTKTKGDNHSHYYLYKIMVFFFFNIYIGRVEATYLRNF